MAKVGVAHLAKCFSYFSLSHGLFISIHARSQCTCELRSCVGPQRLSEPAGSWAQAGKHRAKRFALVVPARQRHGAVMGGDPSKVAPSVFRTAAVSRPHHRLHQPWVAAPRSGAVTRRARRRTSWRRVGATRRSNAPRSRTQARTASAVFAGGARGSVADARTAQSLAAAGVREPLLRNDLAYWPDCFAHDPDPRVLQRLGSPGEQAGTGAGNIIMLTLECFRAIRFSIRLAGRVWKCKSLAGSKSAQADFPLHGWEGGQQKAACQR